MQLDQAAGCRQATGQSRSEKHLEAGLGNPWLVAMLAGLVCGAALAVVRMQPAHDAATGTAGSVSEEASDQSPAAVRAPSIDALIDPLAERLARQPDDPSGWALLGKSYDFVGRHREAADAYREALARGHEDPALEQALRAAESAFLRDALGNGSGALAIASPAEDADVSLRGRVSVAAELLSSVSPDDTVFVYARARTGPPMPIAVIRTRAGDLPAAFTLDDTATMMPGQSLADAGELVVAARISASGNAQSQPGDLIADDVAVQADSGQSIELVIDRVVASAD